MSADNFFVVRRDGARYVVSEGCDSVASDPPVKDGDPRFETASEAFVWACAQPSEYGVRADIVSFDAHTATSRLRWEKAPSSPGRYQWRLPKKCGACCHETYDQGTTDVSAFAMDLVAPDAKPVLVVKRRPGIWCSPDQFLDGKAEWLGPLP